MEIVGRDTERARIAEWLGGVESGARTLLLEGEAGIGKTTVLEAGMADARARGFRVLWTRPAQAEQAMSFAGLADLLGPVVDQVLEQLPPVQRDALDAALLRRLDASDVDPRTVGAATLGALRAAAADEQLLVAIDDVQWLDGATARALAFAVRRLGDDPVVTMIARRAIPGELRPPLGLAALDEEIPVRPLEEAAIGELLDRHLRWRPRRPVLHRVAEVSGGNPLFALELGRALHDRPDPTPGEALPVPERLRDLVLARLRRLPAAHRDVLLYAAASRAPTVSMLAHATGADVGDALDAAEEASLIRRTKDRIAFAHPLYASVLYGASRTSRRRSVHARLAEVIEDAEESARHRAAAIVGHDETVAASLEDAAVRARTRGAADAAAELAEAAKRVTPPEDRDAVTRRQLLAAGYLLDTLNVGSAMSSLAELDDDDVPPETRVEALWLISRLAVRNDPPAAIEMMERALTLLGPGETAQHARVLYLLCVATMNGANSEDAIAHGERAIAIARGLDDPQTEAMSLLYTMHARLMSGRGLDRDDLARTPSFDSGMRSPYWRGVFLSWAGDHAGARAWLDDTTAYLEARGDHFELLALRLLYADLLFRDGDWQQAAALASDAIEEATMAGQEPMATIAAHAVAVPMAAAGDLDGARALLARFEQHARTSTFLPARFYLGWGAGLIELTAGALDHAIVQMERAREITDAAGYFEHGITPFRADLIEALIRTGDMARAEELLEACERRAPYASEPWATISWLRCRELLAATRGDLDAALEAGERAVALLPDLPLPFEVARTLLIHGVTLRRAKRKRPARETLERARALFDGLGASLWAERASDEIARIGGARPEHTTDLTPTEQRIATLAADGLTNQQIADALSVAVRTVESSLTRIYRKLGVQRRAELIRHLSQDG